MKIAWFTPYNSFSAIGKYSQAVISALHARFSITLFLPESDRCQNNLPLPESVIYYTPENILSLLSAFDVAIFNMGDSAHHIEIWTMLKLAHAALIPVVCIQHDWVLFDFFWALLVSANESMEALYKLIETHYGVAGLEKYFAWDKNPTEDIRLSLPLFEPVNQLADAIIVHSQYCADKFSASYHGPIKKLFLPVSISPIGDTALPLLSKTDLGLPGNVPIILSLGLGGSHKQIDKTIQALGKLKKQNSKIDFVFCIVGEQEPGYKKNLERLSVKYNLTKQVVFHGYASEAEKHAYLTHADICINLRNPCMEGASGACLEALIYGKLCIVSNNGSYAEYPDEVVVKITPKLEVEELLVVLPKFLMDASARSAFGVKAAAYAAVQHADERYAEQFAEFMQSMSGQYQQLRAVRDLATTLKIELTNLKLLGENFLSKHVVNELLDFVPEKCHEPAV